MALSKWIQTIPRSLSPGPKLRDSVRQDDLAKKELSARSSNETTRSVASDQMVTPMPGFRFNVNCTNSRAGRGPRGHRISTPGRLVQSDLQAYADRFGTTPRFRYGTRATNLVKHKSDGTGWTVTSESASRRRTELFDQVVIRTDPRRAIHA